jgi:hypothetical protein
VGSTPELAWPVVSGPGVRLTAPLASAFITKMFMCPSSTRAKAIFFPSGDQFGSRSSKGLLAGSFVRFVCELPSEFMTTMSLSAPSSLS